MKRYIRIIIPVLIAMLVIGFAFIRTGQTTATRPKVPRPATYSFDEAQQIAEENLPKFMQSIGSQSQDYGFKNNEETTHATLGKPYIMYSFDLLESADHTTLQGDIRDHLDGGTAIGFPVLVDGEPRSLMSVEYRDGVWQNGTWTSYWPGLGIIVQMQNRLASQGITERVDMLGFGFGWSMFGLIDHNGQTMLIPLQDTGKYFPELDFSGDHLYTLDEVLPLVQVQAKLAVEEIDRQNRDMLSRMPTQAPSLEPTNTTAP